MAVDINEILNYSSDLTVLYVEDDETVREQTVELLEDFFYKVLVAEDGEEGLQKFLSYKKIFDYYPDIVITDIRMPNMDGIEMSRRVLEAYPNQTVIVLSAYNDSQNLMALIDIGISYFLSKPIKPKQIYQTLYKASKKVYHEKAELEYKEKLEEAIKDAEFATKAKDEFLAKVSHEIRTPMNAIIGLSHIMLETELDMTQREHMMKIKSSGDHLLAIINDILDFSKMEAGQLDIEYIEFNINTILDNISNTIGRQAKEKGLALYFNIDKNVPAIIKGDPLRLGQVINNLLNNAVKFTERGEISLNISLISRDNKRDLLQFEVVDTGIGINDTQMKKLFRSFSQGDNSVGRKYGGIGLGLSISKQLVKLMGGSLDVKSEYGQGSKFTFTIITEEVDLRSYRLPSRELMKKRVLIADENAKSASSLVHMLQYFQYKSFQASSVAELQLQIDENDFDIIFIDSSLLKDCDKSLFTACNETKIVAMDATPTVSENSSLNDITIDMHLKKPFTQETIFDTIMELYGEHKTMIDGAENLVKKDELLVLNGSRILLVEDNVLNQTVVLGLLENTGIEIIVANNGQEALKQLKIYDGIELILMDINMPVMDGYEAATYIRKNPLYDLIPMLALTANSTEKDREKSKKLGMQEHLVKPIDASELYRYLLKYIEPKVYIVEESEDTTQEDAITLDDLRKFKEINVEEGIKHTGGNVKLYHDMLVDFVYMFNNSAQQIEQYLKLEEYDRAAKLLHNVKGTSGNIGATNLFNIAILFESAVKNREEEYEVLLDNYKRTFQELTTSISSLMEEQHDEEDEKKVILQAELNELLSEIYVQAKKRRALVCKQLATDLESYEWPEEFKEPLGNITNALKKYRFKNAITTIEEML